MGLLRPRCAISGRRAGWLLAREFRRSVPSGLTNVQNRGLDFADLDIAFFAASMVIPAKAGRLKAIGEFGGTVLTVIFKPLGTEALSIISMRRASSKERSAYGKP
jgi:uncharacterized DUF497 family protein